MTDDYMPDPERTVAYKLLDPGFTKVFAFGTVFGQIGYIIADSWEDAYEELLDHAYEVDGECDHGDPEELRELVEAAHSLKNTGPSRHLSQNAWEGVYAYVDSHCDCESAPNGGYVLMVDNWFLSSGERGLSMTPLELVKALSHHAPTREAISVQLDHLNEWYEPGEDEH